MQASVSAITNLHLQTCTEYLYVKTAAITAACLYTLAQGIGQGEQTVKYTTLADRLLAGLALNHDITADSEAQGLLKEGAAFVGLGRADTCSSMAIIIIWNRLCER